MGRGQSGNIPVAKVVSLANRRVLDCQVKEVIMFRLEAVDQVLKYPRVYSLDLQMSVVKLRNSQLETSIGWAGGVLLSFVPSTLLHLDSAF